MNTETRTLIEIVARTDALFWPSREPFQQRPEQVRHERRRQYAESGLAITGGGTLAERQAFGRMLQTMAADDLLTVTADGSRRGGVRLTALGDATVRRMTGVHTVRDSWPLLTVLGEWQSVFGGSSFPEHLLIGVEEWQGSDAQNARLAEARQMIIPLLPVGYVTCAGDTGDPRRFWLRVAPAGFAALESGPPADAPPEIQLSQGATDLYDAEWDAYASVLDHAVPERRTNICIPVPSGTGWGSLAACLRRSVDSDSQPRLGCRHCGTPVQQVIPIRRRKDSGDGD